MSSDFPIGAAGPRIEVDADGTWLVDGDPIVHPTVLGNLVGRLARRGDGVYVLRVGDGELALVVAEAPFVVRTAEVERGVGGRVAAVRVTLSDGTDEALDLGTLRRLAGAGDAAGERLACMVKGGRFEARLSRFATYQLLVAAEPSPGGRARFETTTGPIVV